MHMDRVDELTCETTGHSHEERDPPLLKHRAVPAARPDPW